MPIQTPLFKHLTASGAVTTNDKAGLLHKIVITGDTAGDKVEIKDGSTTKITLRLDANKSLINIDYPVGSRPQFDTDIDVVITTSNNVEASFVYEEIQQ